jgi:DNA-binding CsgD family transcriptional regulator
MGVPDRKADRLKRLELKTLDSRFCHEIQHGLNCSPFEARAVLEVVRETYFPFLESNQPKLPPGKLSLVGVCADEPAGKPVASCQKRIVCLTVHRGLADDRILQEQGPAGFRRARILEACQDALSQGVLLTREDLAYRVFFVSPGTISRDLSALRKAKPQVLIPLRSTIHDIGSMLTHREQIVRLALKGKTTAEICMLTQHSPGAIANYLSTFARCAQLLQEGLQIGQIAFLLKRGERLIERYAALWKATKRDKNMAYHLNELLNMGKASTKKGVHSKEGRR